MCARISTVQSDTDIACIHNVSYLRKRQDSVSKIQKRFPAKAPLQCVEAEQRWNTWLGLLGLLPASASSAASCWHGLRPAPSLKNSRHRVDAGASICDAGPERGSNVFLWLLGTTGPGKEHDKIPWFLVRKRASGSLYRLAMHRELQPG